MAKHDDAFVNVVARTLSDEALDYKFNSGPGAIQGAPFTLWTKRRVYFPVCHDGVEWAGSVLRDPWPYAEATEHVGGG